jgi:hypothetical protein
MALTEEPSVCGLAFVEAMRAVLALDDLGDNVDLPAVRRNLLALGAAVRTILIDPADTVSDAAEDTGYWQWVAALGAWATQMEAWRAGVRAAFSAWAPADAPGIALKAAVLGVQQPAAPPPPSPTQLRGRIE